jgi:hypothetical protein
MTESPLLVRRVLLPVVMLALAAAELSLAPPTQSLLVPFAVALGLPLLAYLAGWPFRPRTPGELVPARLGAITLLLALLAPWPVGLMREAVTGLPSPLEVTLVETLRNLLLALVVMSAWPICLRLAGFSSLFLVLFAISLADNPPGLNALLAAYVAIATWWLVLVYWSMLRQMHPDETQTARPPWVSVLAVFGLLGLFLALGVAGPAQVATRLGEFFSSSGGTGEYHAGARGGVNDGDEEVSGNNAQSAGFVPADTFIEDDKPSLYDVNNDTYGPPHRNREQERAIALDRTEYQKGKTPAENYRPSRPFSTQREGPKSARKPFDVGHTALFWITGPAPVHLRMQVYDKFDGRTWFEAHKSDRALILASEHDGSPWMHLWPPGPDSLWAGTASHEIAIARLKAFTFPTPAHLTHLRLGRVNQPDFFGWHHDGVLRLRSRTIPTNVILSTRSSVPSDAALAALEMPTTLATKHMAQVPEGHERVAALARDWAGDTPRGWDQVKRVIARLREHAEHDRETVVPPSESKSVEWFLFESRRGPDYLFASAGALMLRSLGYSVRVVSGFYVRPDRFDPTRGQTPVEKDDVHFWIEVNHAGPNAWFVVEPTPGYELLPTPRTWGEWLASWRGLLFPLGMLTLVVGLGWLFHRPMLDAWAVWTWPGLTRGWRTGVLSALRLLERRSRWAGCPRPAAQVPSRWQGDASLQRLGQLADWAAYAPPESAAPASDEAILAVCQASLREWTVQRFRKERTA